MRTISANNLAQAIAEGATIIHFIELRFSGGTVYLCTAPQNILWSGTTWQGTGFNLQVGPTEETSDDRGQGLPLKLSGVDQSIISILLQQYTRGRIVNVYRGWFVPSTGLLADTPLLLFTGYMNEAWTIEEARDEKSEGSTATISTRVSSRLIALDQLRGIRCNLQSHQRFYAGDLAFQFVPSLLNVALEWPAKTYKG